jgi:hypothetical protein
MTEPEQMISELERENFDLKMRLYYLNNEKNHGNHPSHDETAENVVNLLSQRDLTYEQLRAANEEAHNRIGELQSELTILKVKQDSNNSSYENLLLKNQRHGSLQLEENLKRERQAAQAIAKHDAALITNYEKEIERLQDTHHADTLLISECSERVSELMRIVEEKNKELERQHQSLVAAQQHVEVLTDRISKQEILLIKNEQSFKTNAIASLSRGLNPPPPPPPHSVPPPHLWNGNSSHHHLSQSQAPPPPPSMRSSPYGHSETSPSHREQSSSGFQPAPKLGAPFFVSEGIDSPLPGHQHQHQHTSSTFSTSFPFPPHSSHMRPTSPQHPFHSHPMSSSFVPSQPAHQSFPLRKDQLKDSHPFPPFSTSSSARHSSPPHPTRRRSLSPQHRDSTSSAPPPPSVHFHPSTSSSSPSNGTSQDDEVFATNKLRSVLHREVESGKLQIKTLTEENAILRDTLEKNKILLENQEKTLERVRVSAEEMSLLEAEEIARLEVELERMKEERDKWMTSSNRHETQLELLKQELYQRAKNDGDRGGGYGDRERSFLGHDGGLEHHNHSPVFKYRLSSSFTPSSSTHRGASPVGASTSSGMGNNSSKNNFSKSWNPSRSAERNHSAHSSLPESPAIEMYR